MAINKAANEVIANQIPPLLTEAFYNSNEEIWSLQLSLPRRGGERAKGSLNIHAFDSL